MPKKKDRKQSDLERENSELRALNKEMQETYQRVVHDLKNPLANMQVNIHLIQVMGELNENQKESSQIIEKDINDMTRMVLSLLDLDQVKNLNSLSNFEELNFGQLIEVRVNQFQNLAKTRDLTISTNIPDLPFLIIAEPLTIISVIDNLISNAIKYSDKGDIALTVEKSNENVLFSIKDNGDGIPEEDIPMLFNEFFQASRLDMTQGHGLGLYLIKKIVEKYGGKIEVGSEVGKGTEFRVFLPLIGRC